MIKLFIKDIKLLLTDIRALILIFILPIFLITLFSFFYGGVGKNNIKNKEFNLLYYDYDNTQFSEKLIHELDTNAKIKLISMPLPEAQDEIKKGKAYAVLIIYKGFQDSLNNGTNLPIELQFDEAHELELGLISPTLYTVLMQFPYSNGNGMRNKFKKTISKISKNDKNASQALNSHFDQMYFGISKFMEQSSNEPGNNFNFMQPNSVLKETKIIKAKNSRVLGLIQAVVGTAILNLLFSVVGLGSNILDENQGGTLKRLLYAPLTPQTILLSKMLYTNFISFTQLVVLFIFAWLVFGLDITSHLGSILLITIAIAFACSSFGVFIASFARSRQQVQGFSTLIVLSMSAIGGSMMPLTLMPSFMQKIAVFTVNYWGIQCFYDIFWRNLSIFSPTFLSRIAVLFSIGIVLHAIALQLFKKNVLKLNS